MRQTDRPVPVVRILALLLTACFVAPSAQAQKATLKPGACGVRGVESGKVYGRAVTPELEDALRQAGAQLFLDGQPLASGLRIERDGVYTVEVRSAGPLRERWRCDPISFAIDTTPPKVDIVRPDWLPPGAVPRVEVEDDNLVGGAQVFLDGEPYDPAQPVGPGEHLLEAVAEDRAGNVAVSSEKFVQGALVCTPTAWLEYKPPTTILSGVHYFPWYKATPANDPECHHENVNNVLTPKPVHEWCNCIWHPKNGLRPARGFYGNDSQAVVNAQLDQMIAHGIDVVSIEWTGNPGITGNILNRVVPAIASRNLKFVLMYDSSARLAGGHPAENLTLDDPDIRDKFIGDFQTFASSASYFKHPKYLKFGTEPVIYVFITRAYKGSSTNVTNTFNAIRQAAIDNGFSGLYLVADHLFWDTPSWTLLRQTNARAMTAFAPVNPDQGVPQGTTQRVIRTWANKLATLYQNARSAQTAQIPIFDLTPGIFIQWNNIGLSENVNPFCTTWPGPDEAQYGWNLVDGTDWTYMIQTAGLNQAKVAELHMLRPNCSEQVLRNASNGTSIVWTYSYNEWYEGSGVEELTPRTPAYPYGFGLEPLQLLKQKLP